MRTPHCRKSKQLFGMFGVQIKLSSDAISVEENSFTGPFLPHNLMVNDLRSTSAFDHNTNRVHYVDAVVVTKSDGFLRF